MKAAGWGKRTWGWGLRSSGLGLPSLLLTEAANAQTLGGGEPIEIPLLRIAAALIVGILIALGAALVLKRQMGGRFELPRLLNPRLPGRSPRRIRIHETYRLSPHADLCRFTASNREYLVIVSASATEVLAVSEDEGLTPIRSAGQVRK